MNKNLLKLFVITAMAVSIAACSKKTKPDADVGADAGGGGAPVIESKPLAFDPQGSDTGAIPGLYTIHFEYDDSSITPEGKKQLELNVDWMKKNTNLDMQVEGHCDERGSVEYNLALGERRAKSVRSYLVSMGIPANRIRTVSYGKEKKIDNGDTDTSHSKNRRANFVPLPK